ncbi:endonuclease domain-containing protein [Flavitalea flava]
MKKTMFYGASTLTFQRAKDLRNRLTVAENVLWDYLRTKPFGCKFRRQHPFREYIAYFYCHQLKLVIEVDGPIHDNIKKADEERQNIIESEGIKVIRFSNDEIIKNKKCVIEILNSLINVC